MQTHLLVILAAVLSNPAHAADPQVGTLTRVEGKVQIFSYPSKSAEGPSPRVLFEGEYFTARDAKIGDTVEKGNIVRVLPDGKAKVIFPNGDQINVGSGSAYRSTWGGGKPEVSLSYGKIRAVIEKGGPRTGFRIRTGTATMGVRGTDFYVESQGIDGGTQLAVMRGEVDFTPESSTKAESVKAGFQAEVRKTQATAPAVIEPPKPIAKEKLIDIQKATHVKLEAGREAASADVVKQAEQLEKKAVETTLNEVKKADPALYAKLKPSEITSADQIGIEAVKQAVGGDVGKADLKELEDLEKGGYKKYFKNVD